MRIAATDTFGGLAARDAQRLLRHLYEPAAAAEFAAAAELTEDEADARLHAFAAEAWVEPVTGTDGISRWRTTIAGNALAKARVGAKAMPRAEAEALLAQVIDNVERINTDDDEPYRVLRVELFGSLLDETAAEVTDVDMRVLFDARGTRDDLLHAVLDRYPGGVIDAVVRAQRALVRAITGGSRRVDVQLDEIEWRSLPDGVVTRVVYPPPEPQ